MTHSDHGQTQSEQPQLKQKCNIWQMVMDGGIDIAWHYFKSRWVAPQCRVQGDVAK